MKPILVLLIAFLLLVGTAVGSHNVNVGPYRVGFDLGKVCSVVTEGPEESETLQGSKVVNYDISIRNNDGEAHIYINEYPENLIDSSIDSLERQLESLFKGFGFADYNTYYREIDGKPGIVGYAQNPGWPTIYSAIYSPDSKENAGHIICKIASMYSLEEGTQNLLKTIHVELPADSTGAS